MCGHISWVRSERNISLLKHNAETFSKILLYNDHFRRSVFTLFLKICKCFLRSTIKFLTFFFFFRSRSPLVYANLIPPSYYYSSKNYLIFYWKLNILRHFFRSLFPKPKNFSSLFLRMIIKPGKSRKDERPTSENRRKINGLMKGSKIEMKRTFFT